MTDQSLAEIGDEARALFERGDLAGSLAALKRYLNIKPDAAHELALRGAIQNALGDTARGLASLERSVMVAPSLGARRALCQLYMAEGRAADAIAQCRAVIAEDPGNEANRIDLAHALLFAGDYAQGFAEFETRVPRGMAAHRLLRMDKDRWQGEPISSLLVQAEGGYGDMIQFARFLPQACDLAKQVWLRCPPTLAQLMRDCVDRRIKVSLETGGTTAPPTAAWVMMQSLPHVFHVERPESVPARPYVLMVAPERIGRMRVALSWAGTIHRARLSARSLPGDALDRLLLFDAVDWHVVQQGPARQELEAYRELPHVVDRTPEIESWHDTARVIAECDLVVTIDSAVLHLAGAMGKPGIAMLSRAPWWAWPTGDRCAWYPTLLGVRQPRANDWMPVIDRALDLLREYGPRRERHPCLECPQLGADRYGIGDWACVGCERELRHDC